MAPAEPRPRVLAFESLPAGAGLAEALAERVRQRGWKNLPAVLVLSGQDYKLLPAEVPDVPEAERSQALLWGLRDLLDRPPEDTILDSFPFAQGLERPGKRMCYAVAAAKARLAELVALVGEAGLRLEAIDIPELALRNLLRRLPEDAQGLGLVASGSRGACIAIVREGELYLNRQLAGVAELSGACHPLTAPALADQLSLEILRTLDYYDSQLNQRPLAALYLPPLPGDSTVFQELLGANLPLVVARMEPGAICELEPGLQPDWGPGGLRALGGALGLLAAPPRQRINLYTEALKPERRLLDLGRSLGLVAAALALAGGLAWLDWSGELRAQAELERQTASLEALRKSVAEQRQRLAGRSPSPSLSRELAEAGEQLAARRALASALQQGAALERQGYSPVLTGLARQTQPGLWLTRIAAKGARLELEGLAREPEQVARWMEALGEDGALGRRGFASLDLAPTEPPGPLLRFSLRGEPAKEPAR
ncbi:MAG: PilN domain-containing protein [Gammaproteobacteria bacterium]|nr:PilN domain-containing protein [Gammaproteobacteria bacterium]